MPISYWTRGDSPTANNNSLNVEGTNKYPATQVTFQSQTGGDEKLEFNNGLPDPDTEVVVNGITYQFIVEFTGTLDANNKLTDVNGNDLQGEEIMTVTLVGTGPLDGQRIFFLTDPDVPIDEATMDDFPNGAIPISGLVEDCFVAGTLVETPNGAMPVERLQAGDMVTTADGRAVRLTWVGHRRTDASALRADQRPVGIFPKDGRAQIWLSPLHRILVTDPILDRLFAEPAALIAARDMPDLSKWDGSDIHYVHLLTEAHDLVLANGIPVETLYPPRLSKTRLEGLDPLEIEEVQYSERFAGPSLTRKEAALWRRERAIRTRVPA